GRELVLNPLYLDNNRYYIDFEHLEQCAQQGAKTLLFCSPHNPVGRVWTQEELAQLLELAERYQMTIISDEIHADLIFPEQQHIALATLTQTNNVITTLAPSKTFNIAGMGLSSLIVSNKQQRKAIKA
ncbi:aminotransferase class I/II-fold pyridoxal phosphate-dependent enzyme, partial [Methylophaga sp. UBA3996]